MTPSDDAGRIEEPDDNDNGGVRAELVTKALRFVHLNFDKKAERDDGIVEMLAAEFESIEHHAVLSLTTENVTLRSRREAVERNNLKLRDALRPFERMLRRFIEHQVSWTGRGLRNLDDEDMQVYAFWLQKMTPLSTPDITWKEMKVFHAAAKEALAAHAEATAQKEG